MNPEEFRTAVLEMGLELNEKQMAQYARYYELLVEWNEKINLTAITERDEVYLKHFYDSITLGLHTGVLEGEITLCDVGAGAGFPSIPLKIAFPNIKVTIVDSLNKRINFLELLFKELGLEGVRCYHDRAETFGQNPDHRAAYDIVTARAVARMSVLSELCVPLVKKGGYFVAMKAASSQEELDDAKAAIATLGGKVEEDYAFELPKEEGERHIILIKKTKETPKKYPRKPGIPNKKPL
ncbi:16S rRNA (guanine(527)-N(7))-methyltransferase RsmG [Jeotgalibaca porci]|uniref:16S rRNA (guanine(527)-N(7))-methyltransferase RsmG n=1 Tax=Jeotgalibaca porci TaxID=1868793 RepID=UPI003F8F51AE